MSTVDTGETTDSFDVRRNVAVAAALGATSAAVAISYLVRVVGGGTWLDWLVLVVMTALAGAYGSALLDARAPLLVVDRHGVRVREGRNWSGVAWPDVVVVEHLPRRGLLRDGWILVARTDEDDDLTVPLSLSTRVVGLDGVDLSAKLDDLSGGTTEVIEIDPSVGSGEEWWEDETPTADEPTAAASKWPARLRRRCASRAPRSGPTSSTMSIMGRPPARTPSSSTTSATSRFVRSPRPASCAATRRRHGWRGHRRLAARA